MLEKFFSPKSIAVLGASTNKAKLGYAVFKNIIESGYRGKLFPINPHAEEIEGYKCYPSVLDVPEEIDLAAFVIPNKIVPQAIDECGRKGIKAVMIITAGFKEVGGEGAKLEKEVVRIASQYGIRIWGPNCLGIIDTYTPLNASFAPGMPLQGNISFMSQSGALCTAIHDWAMREGIGFSKFVSYGNKADLCETDFLEAFAEDPNTKVIAGYLEDVTDGVRFIRVATQVAKKKPIIILKAGITAEGAKAASSHTGSLAGSERAYAAAFKQAGIIRAMTVEELFDLATAFATQPLPKGRRVAVITNAGGPGIMATDACEKMGLEMTSFESATIDYLKKHLPPAANVYNPVDLIGDASSDRYKLALEAVTKDPNVDGLIVLLAPTAMVDIDETAKVIAQLPQKDDKPVFTSFMGRKSIEGAVEILKSAKIPNYNFPERAAASLLEMAKYAEWRQKPLKEPKNYQVDKEKVKKILEEVKAEGRVNLTTFEAIEVISAYGISTPKTGLAKDMEAAVDLARSIGYPVVMKIASPDILHKSDIGGVKVGLRNDDEIRDFFDLMFIRAKRYMPKAEIQGVIIQEMVSGGKEVILGMSRDPQFGPLLMFGLGGIYVEVLKDVTFRIAPLTEDDAWQMVQEIHSYPLLRGVRGEAPADVKSIVESLLRLSQLVTDFPEMLELDVNPLKVAEEGKGSVAVDVRITIKHEEI